VNNLKNIYNAQSPALLKKQGYDIHENKINGVKIPA